MKQKVLLTGTNGFIGKNLHEYLSPRINLFSPTHTELDLLNTEEVTNFIVNNKIDSIIHAANVGGKRNKLNVKDQVYINLRMFYNIVKNEHLVKKIIYFGSGAEFDKNRAIKSVREEQLGQFIPVDEYGFYKYVCSQFTQNLKSQKILCLRLFGVYGKYEDYTIRFISNAIIKNLLHMPIDINQNVIFDYLYIDDLVKIVDYFLLHKTSYNIYNVCSGKKTDILSIAKIINNISNYKSKITVKKKGFDKEYTGANKRLFSELDAFKFTTLHQGIQSLFHWYNSENLNKINKETL